MSLSSAAPGCTSGTAPEVLPGWSLKTWVGKSWNMLLIQCGPALLWSSEAAGKNVPAAFFRWHFHSNLDQDITQSIERTAMFWYSLSQVKLDQNHCVNPNSTSSLSYYQQPPPGTGLFAWAGDFSTEHHGTDTCGGKTRGITGTRSSLEVSLGGGSSLCCLTKWHF